MMTENNNKVPSGKQYLRINEQATYLGVHPKSIGRIARNDPSFPPEIPLTEGVHGVRVRSLTAIEAWIASKKKKGLEPQDDASSSTITPIERAVRGRGRPRKHPKDPPQ